MSDVKKDDVALKKSLFYTRQGVWLKYPFPFLQDKGIKNNQFCQW